MSSRALEATQATLACTACGEIADPRDPYPFRCPGANRRDDLDHLMARRIAPLPRSLPSGDGSQPFVRYRELLRCCHVARENGMDDGEFVRVVEALDTRVATIESCGLRATPWSRADLLSDALGFAPEGGVWVKDETRNVSGSHKGRHLFGLALHLEVVERLGFTTRTESDRRGLAIASCGNAALAAAVIACATERPLAVFIPPDADATVVSRLLALGARVETCARESGERGDPCMRCYREALAAGALPFCCQGSENGLAIEGGQTLAWEIAAALAGAGNGLDRLFVQVGGGALASACVQGLREATAMRAIPAMPRIHAVQTTGAEPLRRAFERVRAQALKTLRAAAPALDDEDAAARLAATDARAAVAEALRHAQTHRSAFMWAWEPPPASIARGILDDETYDWHAVVAGMMETRGYPVTAREASLAAARDLACRHTAARPDATGAAGLAGLMELRARGAVSPAERVAVLFTGVER